MLHRDLLGADLFYELFSYYFGSQSAKLTLHRQKCSPKTCIIYGWSCYLLWFAVAGQLHSDSSQVGSVDEGQEGRAGSASKHILLILRSLIAPHLRTWEEEEEEETVGWRRHEASLRTRSFLQFTNTKTYFYTNTEKPPVCLFSLISHLKNKTQSYFRNTTTLMEYDELTNNPSSVVNANILNGYLRYYEKV